MLYQRLTIYDHLKNDYDVMISTDLRGLNI